MQLVEGKMRSEDIANFFEFSYSWYRKKGNKEKILEKLKEYAEFEVVYGGVVITKVLQEEFLPPELNLESLFLREIKNLPKSVCYNGEVYGTLTQLAERTLDEVNTVRAKHLWKSWGVDSLKNKYAALSKQYFGNIQLNQKTYHIGGYTDEELEKAKGEKGFRFSCMLIKNGQGYRELTDQERQCFREAFEEVKSQNQEVVEDSFEYCEAAYEKFYGSKEDGEKMLDLLERRAAKIFKEARELFIQKTNLILVPRGTAWLEEKEPEYMWG